MNSALWLLRRYNTPSLCDEDDERADETDADRKDNTSEKRAAALDLSLPHFH